MAPKQRKAGIYVPALTILDETGEIDEAGNEAFLSYLLSYPVDGIVLLGSTGEFTSLSSEEKRAFLSLGLSAVGGKAKVLAHTGCPVAREAIALSNWALDAGAEGVLLIGQYYYAMSQADVFRYFDAMAAKIHGPVYLYNYPARTNSDFAPETVKNLALARPNIVGMKESVSSFGHTRAIMDAVMAVRPDFQILSGFDDQFLDNVDYGGAGGVGGLANLVPGLWCEWVRAKNGGDFLRCIEIKNRIFPLMRLYEITSNTYGLFKWVLKERGLAISAKAMFPYSDPEPAEIDEALALVEAAVGKP